MADQKDARAVSSEIEIDAPREAVWKALTDAAELVRWFPREAKVTPGAGGKIWVSWGGAWAGEQRIAIWEPDKRLLLVEERPPFDPSGQPLTGEAAKPVELTIDYTLEGKGGTTVLRIVNSGFGRDANWDDEMESTGKGWRFELRSLRHYLERHRGQDREVVWAQIHPDVSVAEAWSRLAGPKGMLAVGSFAGLQPGQRYEIRAANGDEFAGEVVLNEPKNGVFAGTVTSLNDALLRIAAEQLAGQTWSMIWIASYGIPKGRVAAMQARMDALLADLFGKPANPPLPLSERSTE